MKDKIKATIKNKSFWGYIFTSIGSYLTGTGDLMSFISTLIGWFN